MLTGLSLLSTSYGPEMSRTELDVWKWPDLIFPVFHATHPQKLEPHVPSYSYYLPRRHYGADSKTLVQA